MKFQACCKQGGNREEGLKKTPKMHKQEKEGKKTYRILKSVN